MNKIKLDPERLQVESFDTSAADGTERGTVHGHYSQRGTCDARAGTCQDGRSCTARCGTVLGCTIAI
jgi:hypothetical protein